MGAFANSRDSRCSWLVACCGRLHYLTVPSNQDDRVQTRSKSSSSFSLFRVFRVKLRSPVRTHSTSLYFSIFGFTFKGQPQKRNEVFFWTTTSSRSLTPNRYDTLDIKILLFSYYILIFQEEILIFTSILTSTNINSASS